MAKERIGALIVFEKETGLQDYIETGIAMDSNISQELLINVFIPNTPLHDGAMIIQGTKIAAAASYLPLSDSPRYLALVQDIELRLVFQKYLMHLPLLYLKKLVIFR